MYWKHDFVIKNFLTQKPRAQIPSTEGFCQTYKGKKLIL